ncbi:MAG: MFS transporter [Bacteroidales bacterium]|jgi:EmrB/QacA subfamily drug resistance transporter|nr:MFS transporter [Bacteroidales bacterium]
MQDKIEINPDKAFKRSVLVVTAFAAYLTPFLGSAVNLALPSIGKDLNASAIGLGWIMSSFILSSAVFLVPFGRLADIVGRKKIFTAGLALFTVSALLIAFAWNMASMIAFRIIQGISGAMIFGTSMAIITSVFPAGERGRAMGINVTAVYLGLSTGPIIGGLLTESFGWRSLFAFLVPFGIAAIILITTQIKKEWADSKGEKFDLTGSLMYGAGLFGVMYGFSKLPSTMGWIFLIAGTALGVFFVLFERKTDKPVFDVRLLFRNRIFAFSGMAALINYSATSAVGFFISLYLQYLKGFDAREAGFVMISQPIAMALLSPIAGRLSDKHDPGKIASIGMGFTAAGLVALCFLTPETPISTIVILLTVLGIGFGLFSSPNSNAIMSSVEKRYLGVASGVVGTMRMVGQMFSMGIAMMLISLFIGNQTINPTTYPGFISGMKTGFVIFAALSFLGIFASLARNRRT